RQAAAESAKAAEIAWHRELHDFMNLPEGEQLRRVGVPPEWQPDPPPDPHAAGGGPGVDDNLVVPDARLAGTEGEAPPDTGSPLSASAGGDSVSTALVLEVRANGEASGR